MKELANYLKNNNTLIRLNLLSENLGINAKENLKLLIYGLKNNKNFEILDLSSCGFHQYNEYFKILVENSSIKRLILKGNLFAFNFKFENSEFLEINLNEKTKNVFRNFYDVRRKYNFYEKNE
jgi:hypothetical protein